MPSGAVSVGSNPTGGTGQKNKLEHSDNLGARLAQGCGLRKRVYTPSSARIASPSSSAFSSPTGTTAGTNDRCRPSTAACLGLDLTRRCRRGRAAWQIYLVMYRYIRTGYLCCQMPCPPELRSFADQDDRLAFRPAAGPGEKAGDICEPDCRDRRRRVAPGHDPVRHAREQFGCHAQGEVDPGHPAAARASVSAV
jgi:hypothetical protein